MQKFAATAITMTLLGSALAGPAVAQNTPSDLRDLVGARAAGAESALTARGYINVGGQAGDDRRWTNWWNERRRMCITVATMNGRFDSIVSTPAPDCRPRPSTLPGPVGGPVASGRTEEIRFERGTSSATRRGAIKGYETMTYLVDLRAGQALSVSLQSSNRSGYFNITAPRADEALFNGSTSGARYRGRVASNGRYKIEVYLMRNAARRGEQARFTLDVAAR